MPLTSKGEEIKSNMEKEYGKKAGEKVFYASANKGTIKGVHNDRRDPMKDNNNNNDGGPGSGPSGHGESALQRSVRSYKPPSSNQGSGGWGGPPKSPSVPTQHKPKPESAAQRSVRTYNPPPKDQTAPSPASGPMATGGPSGTSENLPKTVEPFSKVTDNSPGMSLDAIKAMGKRIGRY